MQIGAHVSSSGGIDKVIERAVAIDADSVQVFTQSPRTWRPTNHDPASFDRFREARAEAGIGGVLCHAVYLCNFAAPDPVTYERSVAALRNTAEVASAIGADGVVRGTWRLHNQRVELAPFEPLPRAARAELEEEARRLEAFAS